MTATAPHMKEFETEFNFFVEHQDELVKAHLGKILVIHGEHLVGAYDSMLDAYKVATQQFAPGTAMIQRCEAGPEAYTVYLTPN